MIIGQLADISSDKLKSLLDVWTPAEEHDHQDDVRLMYELVVFWPDATLRGLVKCAESKLSAVVSTDEPDALISSFQSAMLRGVTLETMPQHRHSEKDRCIQGNNRTSIFLGFHLVLVAVLFQLRTHLLEAQRLRKQSNTAALSRLLEPIARLAHVLVRISQSGIIKDYCDILQGTKHVIRKAVACDTLSILTQKYFPENASAPDTLESGNDDEEESSGIPADEEMQPVDLIRWFRRQAIHLFSAKTIVDYLHRSIPKPLEAHVITVEPATAARMMMPWQTAIQEAAYELDDSTKVEACNKFQPLPSVASEPGGATGLKDVGKLVVEAIIQEVKTRCGPSSVATFGDRVARGVRSPADRIPPIVHQAFQQIAAAEGRKKELGVASSEQPAEVPFSNGAIHCEAILVSLSGVNVDELRELGITVDEDDRDRLNALIEVCVIALHYFKYPIEPIFLSEFERPGHRRL